MTSAIHTSYGNDQLNFKTIYVLKCLRRSHLYQNCGENILYKKIMMIENMKINYIQRLYKKREISNKPVNITLP